MWHKKEVYEAVDMPYGYNKPAGMKFELHIYPDGPHGVALGNRITRCGVDKWEDPCIAKWVEHAVAWAEKV